MNPYSFNVEVYHKRISSHPHPRDILSPNVSSSPTKIRSFLKVLGTLANRKSCAAVAGGIVAVGSIHIVRKGMQWLCRKRSSASARKEKEDAASQNEAGTQTDPPEKLLISGPDPPLPPNANRSGETCSIQETDSTIVVGKSVATVPSANVKKSPIPKAVANEELGNKSSLINEPSDKTAGSRCECTLSKREEKSIPQGIRPVHPFCQLSIVIALLAFHKACSCEKRNPIGNTRDQQTACKERNRGPTGDNPLFNPGRQSVKPFMRTKKGSGVIGESVIKITTVEQSKHESNRSKKNAPASQPHFLLSQTPTRGSKPSEHHVNPFEKQTNRTPEKGLVPLEEHADVFKESEGYSFAGQLCSRKETFINNPFTDTRNGKTSVAAPAIQKNVTDLRANPPKEKSDSRQREKTTKRGGRRSKNVRRRQYVDLDNPHQLRHSTTFNSGLVKEHMAG